MGFLDFVKEIISEPAPESKPERSPFTAEFVREYQNMKRFKGTRRANITVYGDAESADDNCLKLLDGADRLDCVGRTITLTGFRYEMGTGIKVAVDGVHIGVIWGRDNDEVYSAIFNDHIDGVFVRIESALTIGGGCEELHGRAALFALLRK